MYGGLRGFVGFDVISQVDCHFTMIVYFMERRRISFFFFPVRVRFSPTTITSSNKNRFQLAQYLLDINVLFPDVQGVSSSFFLLCRFLDHSIESNPRLISFQSGRKFCSKKITIDDGTQMNHHQGINNSTLSTTCCCVYRLVSFSPFYKFFFTLDCSVEWKASSSSSSSIVLFWYCSRSGLSGRTFPEITQLQRPERRIYEDEDKQKIQKCERISFFFGQHFSYVSFFFLVTVWK